MPKIVCLAFEYLSHTTAFINRLIRLTFYHTDVIKIINKRYLNLLVHCRYLHQPHCLSINALVRWKEKGSDAR